MVNFIHIHANRSSKITHDIITQHKSIYNYKLMDDIFTILVHIGAKLKYILALEHTLHVCNILYVYCAYACVFF